MAKRPDEDTHSYIVAVGSNIEPKKNIEIAIEILAQEQTLIGRSIFLWTKPVGYKEQADFLNGAVCVESLLDCLNFRSYLKAIEKKLKRVKGPIKSGPRTIDLDIIIHNCNVLDDDFYYAPYIREPVLELVKQKNIALIIDETQ